MFTVKMEDATESDENSDTEPEVEEGETADMVATGQAQAAGTSGPGDQPEGTKVVKGTLAPRPRSALIRETGSLGIVGLT